jgi:hypothetical protein
MKCPKRFSAKCKTCCSRKKTSELPVAIEPSTSIVPVGDEKPVATESSTTDDVTTTISIMPVGDVKAYKVVVTAPINMPVSVDDVEDAAEAEAIAEN